MRFIPKFTLTHLFLFVTWCAIGCVVLSRYLATPPYLGVTHDVDGVTFVHYALDESFGTTITPELVANSPAWHPADANPPVSARAALAIADRFRRERLRDKKDWKWGLESVLLLPIDGKNNKWCWEIQFVAQFQGGGSGVPPQFAVFVLMNGEVVVPDAAEYNYLKQWGMLEEEESQKSSSK